MLKITAILSLMLIAIWSHSQVDSKKHKKDAASTGDFEPGSTLWAASLSCDSCGSECASACGTRHFRACCFNYLRRKRGSETVKFWQQIPYEIKLKNEKHQFKKNPLFVDSLPDSWMSSMVSNDFEPYPNEDNAENQVQVIYDA